MMFLITTRNKDSYYELPQETRLGLMQEAIDFVDKRRQEGTCKQLYFAPDMKGSVSIWELESEQQRTRLLLENPMWTYMDIEMQPLLQWEPAIREVREFYAQAVAA